MSLANIIKAYIYTNFQDDENIQALCEAYNIKAQEYLDCLNTLSLPIYTTAPVEGDLLDWVAAGVYGFERPVLPTLAVDDDLFRRIITWHFFKGDGKVFNVPWLKRRIMRFLFGADGINFNVDQTYRVSVVMDASGDVSIQIINNLRTVTGGAFFNRARFNSVQYNQVISTNIVYPPIPEAAILQQAFQSGVLEVPFQFVFTVTQGGFAQFAI